MATIYQDNYSSAWYGLYIDYYANGGDTVPANQSTFKNTSASSVSLYLTISSTIPTRTGYRFVGYATSANGAVKYQPGRQLSKSFSRKATLTNTDVVEKPGGDIYVYRDYTCSDQSYRYSLYAKWEASASTVSTTNGTLGTQQTLTITRESADYTHDLTYSFAGATGTIATDVATSCNWTPPLTLAENIPSAESAACTIYCTTKNGDTVIGTTQTVITLSVPLTAKCTVASVVLAETVAGLNTKFGAFVQNKSKASVTATYNQGNVAPSYGATVASVSININGQVLSTNGAVTNLLYTSGTNSYTVTITDTRGRTDTYNGTFNVLAYSAPTVSETAERDDADDTDINVSYSWNISPCSNLNDKAITISYTPDGGSQTDVSITPATYSGTGTYTISSTDPNENYTVTVTVTDYFGSANASSSVSATGNRILRVDSSTKRVIFYNGIQLGATTLSEAQLQQLLAMI